MAALRRWHWTGRLQKDVVLDQASITINPWETETVVCDMKGGILVTDDAGGDSYSRRSKELTEGYRDYAQANPHRKNKKGDGKGVCYDCLSGGILLRCCGKGCQRRYHPSCVDPPLNYIPPGFWHCIWCVKKKIEFGLHSVSEGVESILDSREVISETEVMQREYFVKYQGLAHAHNCWIPERQILLEAPKLLAKFKKKLQVVRWKRDWTIPHRLLLKRAIILPKQHDQHFGGHEDSGFIYRYEWLVKWNGLGYDHVTWELDDASFMTSSEGMKLIDDYESRWKRAVRLSNSFEANERRKASFAELSVLPFGDSPGFYNQHLCYVNKLCMCWHKSQSALIVDDQIDQERVMKVILFILSLNCNVKKPFLIISTSTGLSVWETEFSHLAPSANLVVYKGNKDVRSGIRALEFSNEHGGVLFQILLSSSDIVVEDIHALRCIPWEAIIIDECQRSRILGHFENFKTLAAEMRLLIVSGQIKEDRADYIKLLSFLKSGHHELNMCQMETFFSASISNLKSQLEQYVAFKCNSSSTRFVEYWVPAQLSSLQLEQYCSMLLSNSMLLCSGQKFDSVDALRELITSTRKCCDHPYLLDQSLHNFITGGLPVEEHLNIGIKASGKLLLLEKILFEVRRCGLRVIILFQSSGGSGSIGNILDDVLCQRFGKDCYVRYGRGYIPSKKQAALDTFNDKEGGKFVFLLENRACVPSIKLSSVDIIILFDSDWDPQNDLRCLQKMSISSQFKQLTVLRLYSYFTVEEKVLMLAKEGITLDGNMQSINLNTCHTLLKWGASYLFNKLDDLHGSGTSVSARDISSDQSLLSDVICELSSKLVCCAGDTDCHGSSFISRAKQNGGEYARNILLLGEREMKDLGNEPYAFSWSDLLKERYPQWKFLSVSSQRIRKTVKHFDHILKESECEIDAILRERMSKDNADPKRRKVSKDNVDPKGRKVTEDNVDPNRREVSKNNVDPEGRKVSKNNFDPKGRRVNKDDGDTTRRKVSKDIVHRKGMKLLKDVVDPKIRKVTKDIIDAKRREVSTDIVNSKSKKVFKDIVDSKYRKTRTKNKKNLCASYRASKLNGSRIGFSKAALDSIVHPLTNEITGAAVIDIQFLEQKKLPDMPKPDISGLCDVLHFSKNIKAVAMKILEHIFKHYNVNCLEVSTMQAFEISVCWLAASLLKHEIDRKDSLDLAKLYLNFYCNEEEVTDVFSELWKHKKDFSSCLQNGLYAEKCNINGASDSMTPELKDLAEEEKQKGFQGSHDLNLMKSATNEQDLRRKSPTTTVLSSQDQTCRETFHSGPYTAHEICPSQKTPDSLAVEADAISMESDADEGLDALTSVKEVSFHEHWNEVPNSCNDPNNVNHVTGSLERQSPVIGTEIAQSDGKVYEDPQILMNEVIAIDNSLSMSTHPVHHNSDETDAVTCDSTAVPEVRQWYNIVSPVFGESTTLEFAETTLPPCMQPSDENLLPLPQ
ncbi:Zinc finger, PHD-type, partial [Sesbania bispinosa]